MSSKREQALKDGLQSISASGGFTGLLQDTATKGKEKPKSKEKAPIYGRMCAVVNIELQEKLQEIAHRNKLTFKVVLEEAMAKAVQSYEEKNGVIKVTGKNIDSKNLF